MSVMSLRRDGPEPSDEAQAWIQALFQAHYAELCRFAVRLVNSHALAEDLVQDVFLHIWRQQGIAGATGMRATRAYLYRSVQNRVFDHLKHQRVEQAWAERVRREDSTMGLTADSELDIGSLAAATRRAVDELPERCRLVFLLRREQDLSYGEIAAMMGVSAKTVENHMGRALRLLRQKLAPYLPLAALVIPMVEMTRVC